MCGHLEPNVSYLTKELVDPVFQEGFMAQKALAKNRQTAGDG